MATFTKTLLGGSTNGRPIKVVATGTAGTTIHTAVSGTSSTDEVWLYAVNTDTVTRTLTIEFGGVTSPDDTIVVGIPSKSGLTLVVPGLPLQNSLVVKAFADAPNVVIITGFVNRIA